MWKLTPSAARFAKGLRQYHVAVVGSGPAGFYTSKFLLKKDRAGFLRSLQSLCAAYVPGRCCKTAALIDSRIIRLAFDMSSLVSDFWAWWAIVAPAMRSCKEVSSRRQYFQDAFCALLCCEPAASDLARLLMSESPGTCMLLCVGFMLTSCRHLGMAFP